MKEGKKLKSILVVMAMLLTALTAVMFGSVSADPAGFNILTPAVNTYFTPGDTCNITWQASNSTDPTATIGFNVTITYFGVAQPMPPGNTNISNLYFNMGALSTDINRGMYKISVHAWNWTANKIAYATNDNVSINITEGTPGYDIWQCGNFTIAGTNNVTLLVGDTGAGEVLNTSTEDLVYDVTKSIQANFTKATWGTKTYYLYKPVYTRHTPSSFEVSWEVVTKAGGWPTINRGTDDKIFEDVELDRAGLWIISDAEPTVGDKHPDANVSTFNQMNATVSAWFWVNGSAYTWETVDPDSVDYGSDTEVELQVAGDNKAVFDVVRSNGTSVFAAGARDVAASNQPWSFFASATNFTRVSTYNALAYYDEDTSVIVYDENPGYYYANDTVGFGSKTKPFGSADNYTYNFAGPWDPPEYWADPEAITVDTGEPVIKLTNASEIYWGFEGRIDVNVTSDGDVKGVEDDDALHGPATISIRNKNGTYLDKDHGANGTSFWINNTAGVGNYSIEFARGSAEWHAMCEDTSANGTWRVFYSYDADSDGNYEWNESATFKVDSSAPTVRLVVTDDGYGAKTDKKIDVSHTDPTAAGPAEEITIAFTIYGNAFGGNHAYFGDQAGAPNYEEADNITVSGDILYPATPVYTGNNGDWTLSVIPTRPGGTITIAVDWNITTATISVDIAIINGTNVASAVDTIYVDQHVNLTVTVTDMDGDPVKTGDVYLFWKGGGAINDTTGVSSESGNGKDGEYTFWIVPDDFTVAMPNNITIAAKTPGSTLWGYAKVVVEKQHDLTVNCTPTTSYAGDPTTYDIDVGLVDGGHPAKTGLTVALYNETGHLVTDIDDKWEKTGQYEIENEEIILSGGTYHLYAYNDTYDSRGNNATIVVTKYTVKVVPSVLAWLIDTDTNLTFTVNSPITDGELTVHNMSGAPNCSSVGDDEPVTIENGTGTLEGVNATTLGNVTFSYEPEDGEPRPANGLLRVTTATASPDPAIIYLNEPTEVTITVTHPATEDPIEDVRVGLDHGMNGTDSMLDQIPDDKFTNANGKVTFGITADASGNVTIYMQNGTDPDNPFVIKTAVRKKMTLETEDPTVNEGATFTVTAKSGGEAITDAIVTVIFDGDSYTTTTGVVELKAPTIQETVDYPIKANAEGYTIDAQTTIKVLNLPNLYITVSKETFSSGETITVKAGADNGNSYGITVTLGDKTKTTAGPDGVTFTAPSVTKDTTYTITATKTGYVDAESVDITVKQAGIPGFELLTLIAAIGVAFILLRRRRH